MTVPYVFPLSSGLEGFFGSSDRAYIAESEKQDSRFRASCRESEAIDICRDVSSERLYEEFGFSALFSNADLWNCCRDVPLERLYEEFGFPADFTNADFSFINFTFRLLTKLLQVRKNIYQID